MGPFCIVVSDVIGHGPSEVLFANRHQPVETLLLDRPDETFGVRIRIRGPVGRLHDAQARVLEVAAHGRSRSQISTRWRVRRWCADAGRPTRFKPSSPSPTDAVRDGSAKLGHPVQNVTREHGLTPLPR